MQEQANVTTLNQPISEALDSVEILMNPLVVLVTRQSVGSQSMHDVLLPSIQNATLLYVQSLGVNRNAMQVTISFL